LHFEILMFRQVVDSGAIRTKRDLQSSLSLPVRRKTTLYTLAAHIMSRLAPLLVSWCYLNVSGFVRYCFSFLLPTISGPGRSVSQLCMCKSS